MNKKRRIFQIKLDDDGIMKFYFIPALEKNEYTELLTGDEKIRVINNMNTWSVNAVVNLDGEIKEKD